MAAIVQDLSTTFLTLSPASIGAISSWNWVKRLAFVSDVFLWITIGYGKNICYQVLPFLFSSKLGRSIARPAVCITSAGYCVCVCTARDLVSRLKSNIAYANLIQMSEAAFSLPSPQPGPEASLYHDYSYEYAQLNGFDEFHTTNSGEH